MKNNKYLSKVECYKCHDHVFDLKEHKKTCNNDYRKVFNSTMECYDCHQQVINLRDHRKVCPNSRYSKSVIDSENKINKQVKDINNTTDFYMLLDVSSSMTGYRLNDAKNALKNIYDDMNESDRISIVSFDTKAFFKLKPRPVGQIRRQKEMPEILDRIFAQGLTAIWDAIYMTFNQIRDKLKKTIIIVLTDGEDNSSVHTFEEVSNLIKQYENISFNIIHINEKPNLQYENLCKNRGEYKIIPETKIVIEITKIFIKNYNN